MKKQREEIPQKGIKEFNRIFYRGGGFDLKNDVKGTWKENAFRYARVLIGSWDTKHEHKELVVGMIFEECLNIG